MYQSIIQIPEEESCKNTNRLRQHLEVEQQILNVMLSSAAAIEKLLDLGLHVDLFDQCHHQLLEAILEEFRESGCLVSRDNYRQRLLREGVSGHLMLHMTVYDKCYIKYATDPNDIGMFFRQLQDNYMAKVVHKGLDELLTVSKCEGYMQASQKLHQRLDDALVRMDSGGSSEDEHVQVAAYKDQFIEWLETPAEAAIKSGFSEIDNRVPGGFTAGHMTLCVAPPGHHKTNLMLNMAMAMADAGHRVWYLNLEDSCNNIIARQMSRRTGIPIKNILAKTLTLEHKQDIASNFNLNMDLFSPSAAISVHYVEGQIRRLSKAPEVLFVDYQNCMAPLTARVQRNDLEIGETLKELRRSGTRHGFAVITAAQLGRDAIRRWRKESAASPDTADILGSQQYGADADCIFALRYDEQDRYRLKVWVIKARYGNRSPFELYVDPERCQVSSMVQDGSMLTGGGNDVVIGQETDTW